MIFSVKGTWVILSQVAWQQGSSSYSFIFEWPHAVLIPALQNVAFACFCMVSFKSFKPLSDAKVSGNSFLAWRRPGCWRKNIQTFGPNATCVKSTLDSWKITDMALGQNLVALVNIKIAGIYGCSPH